MTNLRLTFNFKLLSRDQTLPKNWLGSVSLVHPSPPRWNMASALSGIGGSGGPEESGALRFFPDLNDYEFSDDPPFPGIDDAFSIQGQFVGMDVYNTRGLGEDFRSNRFLFSYTAEKISATLWDVVDLSISDLNSGANFFYDRGTQGPQLFAFTGDNAYFGQRLAIQGRDIDDATARSEFVTYRFIPASPVPEPAALLTSCLLWLCLGLLPIRRRNLSVPMTTPWHTAYHRRLRMTWLRSSAT